MEPSDQREFPARLAMLAETAAFVEAFCARHGVGHDDVLRITLVVEELFTNTVAHGFRGESDAPIGIHLTLRETHVELRYEDRAPPHDLTERLRAPPPALDAPLEMRPVGGFGLQLVGQFSASVRYAHEEGVNRLWLLLVRRASEGGTR